MQRSDDGISRRSLLRFASGGSMLALGGCVEAFKEPPSFDSAHSEYLDRRLLTRATVTADAPYETTLITDRSQLERRVTLEVVSETRANEWRAIDYGTSFLAIFTSKLAVLPHGVLRREVIAGETSESEFTFTVSLSECPSDVSEIEAWAVRFLLVEQWSRNGNPVPETITVESDGLSRC